MKIIIHDINHKEMTSSNGGTFEVCGIKWRGTWYSGPSNEITKNWTIGEEVEIDTWFEQSKKDPDKKYGKFVPLVAKKDSAEPKKKEEVPPPPTAKDEPPQKTIENPEGLDDLPF